MSNLYTKIISIILWILMGVSILLVILFYFGKVVPGTKETNLEEPVITQTILVWTYILFFLTAGLALIFPIINVILNPKSAKQGLFIFLGAVVLIFIAYNLASDQVLDMPGYDGKDNVPNTLKLAGTGLMVAYILAGLAVLSILYSEIVKYFK
jgi:hypothetical protein